MTQERKKLVELKNVSLTFNKGKSNEVEAIDDVSFDIYEGEIFGLVGESGSGKTTIGRSVLKLSDIDSGTDKHKEGHRDAKSLYTKRQTFDNG